MFAKKYRPNLVELMNLSEINYMLMMRLMGQKAGLTIKKSKDKVGGEQVRVDEQGHNTEVVGAKKHFFISDFVF